MWDFNPRSPHGERHLFQFSGGGADIISIHAPRTGSDSSTFASTVVMSDFNPRSPHGERHAPRCADGRVCKFQSTLPARGATGYRVRRNRARTFQSTLPARGATITPSPPPRPPRDFNPRSPHGERQCVLVHHGGGFGISIHAPRTGSDLISSGVRFSRRISIHAPRTGSDASWLSASARSDISIHAPRTGSDHTSAHLRANSKKFQSTLPARGATLALSKMSRTPLYFNPRSPHGERPSTFADLLGSAHFNPRSPHGERLLVRR